MVEGGHSFSGYRRLTGEEDCRSGASMVDDGKDGVVSVTVRQTRDEVHGYRLKGKGSFFGRDAE